MTSFADRAKHFGLKRLLKSFDLLLAVILTLSAIIYFKSHYPGDEFFLNMLDDISSASITITTIILAGFAIIISFSDDGFVSMLKRVGVFSNTVFIFEYTTILAIATYLLSLFLKYFYFNIKIFYFQIFLFSYLLLALINLVLFISNLGMQKSAYVEIKEQKEAIEKKRLSTRKRA